MFNLFKKQSDYKIIDNPNLEELKKKYSGVWQDDSFPEKQWRRVEKQLKNIDDVPEFRTIRECVKATKLKQPSILEVGCSSGYLSKVLQNTKYEGTDYSPAFINFAKQKFPKNKFTVNDATDLKYKNKSFDIVISGCCLLHILNYKKAISEAVRVAKKYVIFHRTPVLLSFPTTYLTKTAYGQKMLEIHFNEEELVILFFKNKLAIIKILILGEQNENMIMRNYVCKKLS